MKPLDASPMNSQVPLTSGRITLGGAPDGFDARLISELVVRAGGPVLHVARDDSRMVSLKTSLEFVDPQLPVLTFPAWDCLPYAGCGEVGEFCGRSWQADRC